VSAPCPTEGYHEAHRWDGGGCPGHAPPVPLRLYAVQRVLPAWAVVPDDGVIPHPLLHDTVHRMGHELIDMLDADGMVPYGPCQVQISRALWPIGEDRRRWWQRLLRKPPRTDPPPYLLRAEQKAVPA
jgi:hypothetical protein